MAAPIPDKQTVNPDGTPTAPLVHGVSFYDLTTPDWDGALKAWNALEAKAATEIERQTMRLHVINVLLKQGKADHARLLLDTVTEPALQGQKEKLVAQLPAAAEK